MKRHEAPTSTPDAGTFERVRAALSAASDSFTELTKLAGLDPARDFRWAELSNMDMRGADLRGFDFSFSLFRDVDVTGANVTGTQFGGADLTGTDLTKAKGFELSTVVVSLDPGATQLERRFPNLTIFRDTLRDGTFGPELVVIPGGTFTMGSPEDEEDRRDAEDPQHTVNVPRFALGRYAVTFEEYDRYCAAKGIEPPKVEGRGRGRRPVINVSWKNAQTYCAWLSSETGKVYRLPSEAEWEYACRAGTVTRYSWGDAFDDKMANIGGETREVGLYPANLWKLHDMHGYVAEWCDDDWHDSYEAAPNDEKSWVGKPRSSGRVVRGGTSSRNIRAAFRRWLRAESRGNYLGFRVASTLAP